MTDLPREYLQVYVLDIGDVPGHQLTAFECTYEHTIDGGLDLVLPIHCGSHGRNWYWCLNVGRVWCDGGPPDWHWHLLEDPK